MAAPGSSSLLLLLVVLGWQSVALGNSWNPSCTGEFSCSSISSTHPGLWEEYLGNGFVKCRYGHTEIDGTCERPCDGVRAAPCRCQTKEEAELGVASGAKTSLFVCIAIVCAGLFCSLGACLCMKRCGKAEKRSLEVEAQASAAESADARAEEGEGAGNGGEGAQEAGADGETSPGSSPSPDSSSSAARAQQQLSVLERALGKARLLGFENPRKAKIMRWFFPLLALGISAWGAYEILSKQDHYEGQFYDHLETFLGVVAIISLLVALILLLCTSIDSNPLICAVRTLTVAFQIVPLIGVAGLVWSLIRMTDPDGIYHACEARHCIFELC